MLIISSLLYLYSVNDQPIALLVNVQLFSMLEDVANISKLSKNANSTLFIFSIILPYLFIK